MFRHRRSALGRNGSDGGEVRNVGSVVVTIDDPNFSALTRGTLTAVNFWAPWCGPCRTFAPIFEECAADNQHRARFGTCNIDTSPASEAALRIVGVPTLVFFAQDGREVARIDGMMPREDLEFVLDRVIVAMG